MPARRTVTAVATVLLSLGALAATTTPATAATSGGSAILNDCRAWTHGSKGSSKCTGIGAWGHQVKVTCAGNGGTFYVWGEPARSGYTSTASCHPQGLFRAISASYHILDK
ncbi:hypothetical protein ACFYT4_33975 [Streptomyces sp. NPDC004609]|uniref:hypothetical protein n=1 Tax=Streptomyces sp. NPDC004609 TaxID=3364704 RepID=UPI00367C07EC